MFQKKGKYYIQNIKFNINSKLLIKMPAISHLNPTWEHTLTDILDHDPKTQMGIIMRAWVKDNNMTEFTSMLITKKRLMLRHQQ